MNLRETFGGVAPGALALPLKWQGALAAEWQRRRAGGELMQAAHAGAWLHDTVQSLEVLRLPLDATDADICIHAERLAARASELARVYHQVTDLRQAMARLAAGQGVTPPDDKKQDAPAVARMADPIWWRRQLRKAHGKAVEGAAIDLGFVSKAREIYVSQQSVWRRAAQNDRNAASLEATIATNEEGQEFTLAELAAKGPANKAIRRAELMTRISGFERIARDLGHAGLFVTVTCPSYMHKWRTVKGQARVIENPRYDGTLPGQAQKYLATVWARTRASLKRQGIGIYGFRIAEPQHDGTPHWHSLLFVEARHLEALQATIRAYALKEAPGEPGAHAHRADFKTIDWERGSAAGYIAKYVAKNIDGYRLDKDLFGNDAIETSHRVEAWASTWGIRQFQQIGGAPVGPWRELRRVKTMPAGAPDNMVQAWQAVNKITDLEAGTVKSVAWDRYTKAQGGVFIGRKYCIRVATAPQEGTGRYGEPLANKPCGVEMLTQETYTPAHMAWMGGRATRAVHWFVESKRYQWTITRQGGGVQRAGEAAAPWTRVNNCTQLSAGIGPADLDPPGFAGNFEGKNDVSSMASGQSSDRRGGARRAGGHSARS